MKRIWLIGLALVAAGALSGTAASTSGAKCVEAYPPNTGKFEDSACNNGMANGRYVKIIERTHNIIGEIWCAEVGLNEGFYKEEKCAEEGTEPRNYRLVVIQPSPKWRHRGNSKEGEGASIEEKSPEHFQGAGSEQKLTAELVSMPVEINANEEQVKGIIYNTKLQGQIKIEIKYHEPRLIKPALEKCEVKVGENNTINAAGHLAWKWSGNPNQLKILPQLKAQFPDIIFTPKNTEIEENAKELPKGTFTTITLKDPSGGSGCGLLAGTFKVEGSEVGEPKPENIGEWSTQLNVRTPEGKKKQHFWNGKEFVGVETGLIFGGNPASLVGSTEAHAAVQEVSVSEG